METDWEGNRSLSSQFSDLEGFDGFLNFLLTHHNKGQFSPKNIAEQLTSSEEQIMSYFLILKKAFNLFRSIQSVSVTGNKALNTCYQSKPSNFHSTPEEAQDHKNSHIDHAIQGINHHQNQRMNAPILPNKHTLTQFQRRPTIPDAKLHRSSQLETMLTLEESAAVHSIQILPPILKSTLAAKESEENSIEMSMLQNLSDFFYLSSIRPLVFSHFTPKFHDLIQSYPSFFQEYNDGWVTSQEGQNFAKQYLQFKRMNSVPKFLSYNHKKLYITKEKR